MKIRTMTAAGLLAATLLAGCGGGSGGTMDAGTPATTAEGLWDGIMDAGTPANARTFSALVLDDGSLWLLYSTTGNSIIPVGAGNLGGVMQGIGTSNAGIYSIPNTSNSWIFPIGGTSSALTLAATYTEKSRFDGAISPGSIPFASLYDTAYNLPSGVASLAGGPYTSTTAATLPGQETATFSMDMAGHLTAVTNSSACNINGTFTARTKGAYNVSLTFGNTATCGAILGSTTINGMATYDAISRQLNVLAVNNAKTAVFVLIGTRP